MQMKAVFEAAMFALLFITSGIDGTTKAQDVRAILMQADSLGEAGDYVGAIALLEKNINQFETGTPDGAFVWLQLGYFRSYAKDYEQAKTCYLKCVDLCKPYLESNPGEYAYRYSSCLSFLSVAYAQLSDIQSAIRVCKENIELIERYKGYFEDYAFVLAYSFLSQCYLAAKDYSLAEWSAQEALRLDSTQTWVKANLAHALLFQGKIQQAEELYHQLAQTVSYEKYSTYASSLLDDLYQLEETGAIPHNIKQDVVRIKTYLIHVDESIRRAKVRVSTLYEKGNEYYQAGDYVQAEQYWLEVKDIIEKMLGADHPECISFFNNLGDLYHRMGDYAEAEKYLVWATENMKKMSHPYYSIALSNLGGLYCKMGDYVQAEKCLEEAKEIITNKVDKRHLAHVSLLGNIGMTYVSMGNYIQAEKYLVEAEDIMKILDTEHPIYIFLLSNLGLLYFAIDDNEKAEKYWLQAKEIRENILDKEHPDHALSLINIGLLHYDMEDYMQAEKYHLEAAEILEKALGKDHPDYAVALSNLGLLYHKTGDYTQAEKYYLEAKENREKALGREHPAYAASLDCLGLLYSDMEDYEKATPFENEACQLTIQTTIHNFAFLSEQQRTSYWTTQSETFEVAYALSRFHSITATNTLNYNNTLFTKGLLLRTATAVRDAIYSSGNHALIEQYEQLGSLRREINILQQKTDFNKEYVASLASRADSLDKALTQASAAFRDLKADMSMQWQDVQRQLKPDDAAVEFVHFRLYDKKWTDSTFYAALVLRQGMRFPTWIPLCEQEQLQEVLHTDTHDTQQQTETLYSEKGNQLHQLVWQALEKELSNVKNIYYAPSGLLHKIAFNALPTEKNDSLLSDKYNLYLVSSTREVARLKKETTAFTRDTASLYGGLLYDASQAAMIAAAKRYQRPSSNGRFLDRFRKRTAGLPSAELRSGFSEWKYLEGTKTETERIAAALSSRNIPHRFYTENAGNEESFKNLNGTQTGVIHLATHGFFLPDVENKLVDDIVRRLGGNRDKPFENPLLRSGLILSGANNQWRAKKYDLLDENIEDGILTADEISRLNLTKTKLVVLSACETGLGNVTNSEGVFGLQRAFKLAGVESLIMSLWKVPDGATSELMSTFYDEWLAGKSKQNAFKTAQQKVRDKYISPYYWAAFVMMD
jgi:CHAT domain-containing protein/Flp pilus assembly protein TadD